METLKVLIKRGADPSLKSSNGSTALHFAARRGNDQITELLLGHAKVDVNAKDLSLMSPLHLACISGNADMVKMLLDKGADLRAKTNELMTPLHVSLFYGNTDVTALILRTGESKVNGSCISVNICPPCLWIRARDNIIKRRVC